MKRFLLIAVLGLFIATTSNAQELGIRFGDSFGSGTGVAIDGVFALGEMNRIHADVSFGSNGVGMEALWDFLYRPLSGEAFNWYVGAGPSLFLGSPFLLGISGEIGLEYHFNEVPIALGVDWRPTFVIIENTDFSAGGFGFNVRWVFNRGGQ